MFTRSPATRPWFDGADRDRRLAGEHAGARLDPWPQLADRVDQLQGRPHGAFGVVLVGGRCAPHGHHGVADELLDGAAVAPDDLGRAGSK